MPTQTDDDCTRGVSPSEEASDAEAVQSGIEESSTHATPLKTARTVPSSLTGSSNWLSYAPREPRSGPGEAKTQA